MNPIRRSALRAMPFLLLLAGCGDGGAPVPAASEAHDHDHGHAAGIAVPANVRDNLGVTFARAEYRVVQGLLRLPGRFEAEPWARRAYQMPLAGRVEVLVRPFQRVAAGDPLYRVAATGWDDLRRELAEAEAAVRSAGERHAAAREHAVTAEGAVTAWRARIAALERLAAETGGRAAELAEARTRLADLLERLAEVRSREADLRLAADGADGAPGLAAIRFEHLLAQAGRITGLDAAALLADDGGRPRWRTIDRPTVLAAAGGVIEGEIAGAGEWLDERATVLRIADPSGVRFRASALQADLPRLRDGMPARIVAADPHDGMRIAADVALAPAADALDRSVELIARPAAGTTVLAGVRPGVAALLEVVVAGGADEELAIPIASTIRDGLRTIIFRRDPRNPDAVAALEADLGAGDGRWVVVNSGLKEGDEVVLGGIYPLKLSQQEGGSAAGHFEADGTFHTGKH